MARNCGICGAATGRSWVPLFKGIAAGFSNFVGAESESLNSKLSQARAVVLGRLRERAVTLGANAIIGVDLDYTMFGDSILGVIGSGTAVVVARN